MNPEKELAAAVTAELLAFLVFPFVSMLIAAPWADDLVREIRVEFWLSHSTPHGIKGEGSGLCSRRSGCLFGRPIGVSVSRRCFGLGTSSLAPLRSGIA